MTVDAGDAFLDIIPRLQDFGAKLSRQVSGETPALARAGQQAGDAVAKGVEAGTGRASSAFGTFRDRARSSLGVVASAASTATGGLNPLAGALDNVSTGLANVDRAGPRVGRTLAGVGLGVTAVGALLTRMGDESKRATAQLETAIENAGQSVDDFEPRIAAVSKRLIKLGFDDEATARSLATLTTATQDTGKSLDLMGLAADIAAARHISLESASDKLAKIQSGNTRVFKEFGIELEANASATERAAAMTELQARVQGQAAAQADNFTGRLKSLAIQAENVAEEVGEKAGPALTVLGTVAAGVGGVVQSGLLPKLQQLGAVLRANAGTIGITGVALTGLAVAFLKTREEARLTGDELVRLSKRSSDEITRQLDDAAAKTQKQSKVLSLYGVQSVVKANDALADNFRSLAEVNFGAAQRVVEGLDAQGASSGKAGQKLKLYQGILDEVAKGNTQFARDQGAASAATEQASGRTLGMVAALDKFTESQKEAGQQTDAWANATERAKSMAKEASVEVSELDAKLKRLTEGAVSVDRATSAYESSLDDLSDSLKENGTSLDLNSEKGRKNVGAIDDLVDAGTRHLRSLLESGAGMDDLRSTFDRHIDDFRRTLRQMGFNEQQVDELTRKYGLVPENVDTWVNLHNAQAVLAKVQEIQTAFSGLDGRTATLSVNLFGAENVRNALTSIAADAGNILASTSRSLPPGSGLNASADLEPHAAGGDFAANRWLLLGEAGREIVRFDRPGSVMTHPETERFLTQPAASLPPLDYDRLGEAVARALVSALDARPPRAEVSVRALAQEQQAYRRMRQPAV